MIEEERWDPKLEESLLRTWEKEALYRFDRHTKKPIFSIDTPPPYASGPWHVGGATHYAQIDMIARYFRMRGYEVLFPFGIDRNGLPVEVEVEKELGIRMQDVGRERFLELCREFLDRVEGQIIRIAKRLGMSCDFEHLYRTDSPEYRRVTQATFIELWRRGLIYEADRPTNWCPRCQTAIADAEVEYREEEADLYYIRFGLEDGGKIVVATTRPELLCSCKAIIFNPIDGRYTGLEGKKASVPIFGQWVPILPHPFAKPEFGTGLVMVCSFGDYSDIRLFRELGLEPTIAISPDGRMNEHAGPYAGLSVREARKRVVEDLRATGSLVSVERVKHRIPVCWRSKDPVEFIAMKEYYLKQLEFLGDLLEVIDRIEFYPPEKKRVLLDWIGSLSSDWPISRRRFYGTEIPIWYCKHCGRPWLPEPGRYYQPWKERAPFERCTCGSTEFVGEERTFDTWMDSSISQLFVLGYGWDDELFRRCYPCTLRPQGVDIVRTWLYYSILRSYLLLKDRAFEKVRISGMGLDERGEAMHKSKGNVIYPEPFLEKYGADAFRLWGALEASLGSDYRFSEGRLRGASKFLTKLWNLGRFVSCFPRVEEGYELAPLDRVILANLNKLIRICREGYEKMDVFIPANAIRTFAWHVFADHYVEAVKARSYNAEGRFSREAQRGAWWTLSTSLGILLRLLAPICPFITDALWRRLFGGSVHSQPFPEAVEAWEDERYRQLLGPFIEFNRAIWAYKKSRGISLAEGLDFVQAPKELEPLGPDLQAMHKIRELSFGEELTIR